MSLIAELKYVRIIELMMTSQQAKAVVKFRASAALSAKSSLS